MNTELPSKYDPSSVEAQAYKVWIDEQCFHADPSAPGEGYSIVIPPPNVTGALHLGHAINCTLQDILARMHRMAGFNTLWVPGIDHAGIATQAVVEKQLKEQENKTRHDVGREGLVERIWKWKEQYGNRIIEQLKRLGCSCDWGRTRFTLDEMCARTVRETFFKLFKDGLIYRGKRLVNWDTFLQTSISDDEIYHETVKTFLWHIRYPIEIGAAGAGDHPTHMIVATTRPETMLGDTAVAVYSQDPRWSWAIGKQVRLPLTNRLIPIIADDILVDPAFGTGVVKVTPAHDPNDYAVWQRHKGQPDEIDLINMLTPDGKITSDHPEWSKYAGMKRDAARKLIVEDLKAAGLLEKEEPYETQVGHSDRSKTPIEPYLSDQWFVKMAPLAEPALQAVREGKIKFYPERHAQQYLSWLGEKRDWPVSRQLWWGHRIPVWSKEYPDNFVAADAQLRLSKLLTKAKVGSVSLSESADASDEISYHLGKLDGGRYILFVCTRPGQEPLESLLDEAGFVQDPDVLDTWFSSALWPHSTLGWPEKTPELAKYYPTSVLLTGRDIITLWVARMVMMGMYNMGANAQASLSPSPLYSGEGAGVRGGTSNGPDSTVDSAPRNIPASTAKDVPPSGTYDTADPRLSSPGPSPQSSSVGSAPPNVPAFSAQYVPPSGTYDRESEARALGLPFLDVCINPTILDGKGERMSKSKGNGVDPVDIIDSYGADALRFTLTKMATETQDARMPVKRDASGKNTSDKFDEGRNFCNKLWNACRFALANLENVKAEDAAKEQAAEQQFVGEAPGKTSDEDLMQRTQQGDRLAFSQLFERYNAPVLTYLYGILGDAEQVESLGQEVFLRAFRFAGTYQYPHKFSTWLLTITRNLAVNQSRRRGSSPKITKLNLEGIDLSGDPYQVAARATDDLEKQEEIARVLKALDTLPPDQTEVIRLGVFQDLSFEKMEEITGTKAVTLRSRMFHGLKELAKITKQDPQSFASPMTLADRWVISRFHRTVAACDDAIKSYRFDVYAKSCYDFFWGDFCDWYVEAIKPAMKDPARSGQTADVLAAVLDGSLRLMHPMIPFITETIWWRLNEVRPQRGLPGLLECPPSKRLVHAKWPTAHVASDEAETIFPKLQEVIGAVRTIRNDYQKSPRQTVDVYIKAPGDSAAVIEGNRELIEMLATCTIKAVRADLPPVPNAVTVNAAGYEIFLEGLIDPNAEHARLTKEFETKKKLVDSMKARLSNESYIAKAPPHLVKQSRDQLAEAEAELAKLEESLRKLGN